MTDYGCLFCFSYITNPSTPSTEVLRSAIPTGYRFRDFLVERYGFKLENITMVTDENQKTPAKPYVVQILCECVKKLKRGDTFVYLFIGHGGRWTARYLDSTGFVEYQACGDDDMGFSTAIEDFTLRYIVERIPKGVYFTMISDNCCSGGILDSATELYGFSHRTKSITGRPSGIAAYLTPEPRSPLLDLPEPSGRELGICFTACQSHQITWGGYDPMVKRFQTQFCQSLMDLAIACDGHISNFGMIVGAHQDCHQNGKNPLQMPGLYGSVDQGNLIFLGKEKFLMSSSPLQRDSFGVGPSNSLGFEGYVAGNRVTKVVCGEVGVSTSSTNYGEENFNSESVTAQARDGFSLGISGGSVGMCASHEAEIHGADVSAHRTNSVGDMEHQVEDAGNQGQTGESVPDPGLMDEIIPDDINRKYTVGDSQEMMSHTERNIAETGLNLLLEMLKKFQGSEFCNRFYRTYFLTTENEIIAVLTDTFHKPGFKLHVLVLQHLFCLLETGVLTEPLWDVATSPQSYPSNAVFVREYTIKLLSASFPNMTTAEVTQFVNGLFESTNDLSTFKTHIRDFLIQSKEFSAQDNKDLYAEEAAAQRERERQRMLSIPGLIAPIELQDEMVDS